MATEAGIISALIGTATATAVDGTVRNLQVGDRVYPNEIITTGLAGAIEIEFPDGSVMDLGRNSQAVLDSETFELDVADAETPTPAADVVDEIEAIQQALLAGEDPTQIADATAAGPGALPTSEGGSDAVVVDYLAPRITPDSGFETTGPGIAFLDPPPFDFLVDESDDLDPIDPTDPGPDPVAPISPTLLISVGNLLAPSNLIKNGGFENLGVPNLSLGSAGFAKLETMPGWSLVEGSALMEPHAAGHGGVGTPSAELDSKYFPNGGGKHFMDLGASPGNIAIQQNVEGLKSGLEYNLSFAFISKAIKMANNSTSGEMEVYWSGKLIATIGGEGNSIDLHDGNGPQKANLAEWQLIQIPVIADPNNGFDSLVFKEVGKADAHGIAIDNVSLEPAFHEYVLNITAGTNGSEGELSFVSLSADSLPAGVSIYGLTPTDGVYQIELDSSGKAVWTLISENELSELDINKISGSVTLTVGDTSSSVTETAYWEVTGQDTDDILQSTAANDILTGGAGKDVFVWNAGDEGIVGTPAMDIVTDFNIAEGDVLDFSDILVGEESGNLTDFISITEDGSDIVIELKPDATDVTQIVTLQGKSLADLGLGGFDTSTQQAEMINKLVQDGHVSVDS